MSYLTFLLLWVVAPTCFLLLYLKARAHLKPQSMLLQWHWVGSAILALIAFFWTTPWDNFIVARGIWSYGAERVIGVMGYVPLEEYLFFILMPLFNSTLFATLFLRGLKVESTWRERQIGSRAIVLVAGILLMLLAASLLKQERFGYLSFTLLWFVPPLVLQWFFDPRALQQKLGLILAATLLPTLYFSIADAFAIADGIWSINPMTRTGWEMGHLPFEETFFFFITSLLLAQGLVLWHSLRRV
ncbi:MAG: lycopene cyclase domain-containing protein [Opitutales bacterium]